MRHQPSLGIRAKVLILTLLPATTVTLLLVLYFSLSQTQYLEESLNDRGMAIVRQLAPACEYGVFSGNHDILKPLADAILQEMDVRAVLIRSNSGRISVTTGKIMSVAALLDKKSLLVTQAISNDGKSNIFQAPIMQTELALDSVLDMSAQLTNNKNERPNKNIRILGWVSVELTRDRTAHRQLEIWRNTSLIALSILILSAFMAIRLGRSITRPIRQLKDAVNALEVGNLDMQVNTGASAELLALENGINNMALALRDSRDELQNRIEQATQELRTTLKDLGVRNQELDVARRDAESANRTKSVFLANISHEIRTPLNGVLGFLTLLAKTSIDSTQREFIEKIDKSTRMLLSLLNDILDFSKIEVGKLNIITTDFNLRELLDESVYLSIPDAHSKGLGLVVIVNDNTPTRLSGGADRISQIIKNLVSNAVKFTNSGEITVAADTQQPSANAMLLRICVADTGIGIAPQDCARLFLPFSQLDAGMNRRFGGTGLGLAISKSLAELMGGTIIVDSVAGKGTRFMVTLPVTLGQLSITEQTRMSILRGRHVLVLSPHQQIHRSLTGTMQHLGMLTEHATSGAEAIAIWHSTIDKNITFDAIIIDGKLASHEITIFLDEISVTHNYDACSIIHLQDGNPTNQTNNTIAYTFDGQLSRPPLSTEVTNLLCRLLSGMKDRRCKQRSQLTQSTLNSSITSPIIRVLLADDNLINRQFLATWLQQYQVLVHEAEDGEDAIHACKYEHFDLILLDLHMPHVDGIEAATHIREAGYIATTTPIIVITADATDEAKHRIDNSVINDVLIKPVEESQLFQLMRKWCPRFSSIAPEPRMVADNSDMPVQDSIVDKILGLRLASGKVDLWQWSLSTLADRLPSQIAQLQKDVALTNTTAIRELTHTIIGAASYCGAIAIARIAAELNHAAHAHDIQLMQHMLAELVQEHARFISWMQHQDDALSQV
jgi:two-component system sensor histidine kinase BarA